MRRLSLSTKLFAAVLPLILAVGGLLALTVRSDLEEINRAESGADLGAVWEPLIAALNAVETEADTLDEPGTVGDAADADAGTRRATDQAINDLRTSIEKLGAFEAASAHVTAGRSALSAARRNIDMAAIAPSMASDIDPVEAYGAASRELVAVGQLLPSEAGDAELGRELLAVVKLAEAKLHADEVLAGTRAWANDSTGTAPLTQARVAFGNLLTTFGEFEAIAPTDWGADFRESGFTTTLGRFNTDLASVARAAEAGRVESFDSDAFETFIDQVVVFERTISQSIVDGANAEAVATSSATLIRIGIILAIVLLATVIAWFITRSVTRRVKAVANSANRVASDQLPALVEALRDPRGKAVLPEIEPVDAKGSDDLADLARAFNSMQETLIDVAHEQVEVLRRGVSDIFITMARRNRSLIDRQLSMLDEFEASVDDHEVLSNYYQLDHLATRMRRNSESLLVLANAEPKRRRVKATEIDDVVRASIGEVEDYRRVEIQHLESLQVRGNVVADVSHLLAELLDNATSFSPPGSPVRVGGRRADDSYLLRIVDDGVGIGPDRLAELNELLREPPIVGLSVESTLGISVVSLLANKHDIGVTLSAGSPGLTVDVILPSSLFGPMDAPAEQPITPAVEPTTPDEQIIAWNDQPTDEPIVADQIAADQFVADQFVSEAPTAPPAETPTFTPTAAPTSEPLWTSEQTAESTHGPVVEPTIAAGDVTQSGVAAEPARPAPEPMDWTKMSLDVPSFDTQPTEPVEATAPVEPVAATPESVDAIAPEPAVVADVDATPHRAAESFSTEPAVESFGTDPVAEPVPAEPVPAEMVHTEPVTEPTISPDTTPSPIVAAEPARPAPEPADWTKMSLDLSAFDVVRPTERPEPAPAEPVAASAAAPDIAPAPAEPDVPVASEASTLHLPPPAPARSEFGVPPAPPISTNSPSQRPVSPDTARPAPVPTGTDTSPSLPTRTQRGTGPEGPDRLAPTDGAPVTTSEPGALQAALAAYDSGRSAVNAPTAGILPTRDRNDDPGPIADEPQAVTQSRVEPSALRDRLRAFQSEFTSASGDNPGGTDIYTEHHPDLGGDPR